ncbi:MAG TPA: cation:proton antiporter [Lacunisphaera sp.]|nr:cation:proton antiporter [Lacunisphaera sp.]
MGLLLLFGLTLFLAVLVSELADRSVLSTAVLFLAAGVAAGSAGSPMVAGYTDMPLLGDLADFALVAVLFTDGMKLGWGELRQGWTLSGRALLLGLPLTLGLTAVFAHGLTELPVMESVLVAAVLSPTDPVFASAIVGRPGVSGSLRRLLNVESGLNDGLALPIVLAILAWGGAQATGGLVSLGELAFGVLLGVTGAWIAVRVERWRIFRVAHSHEPFLPVAVGLVVFAAAKLSGANEFLAAFAAGVTLISGRSGRTGAFHGFSENLAELLKLAALLVFGALVSVDLLSAQPAGAYLFAVLVLVVARPLALALSLAGSSLSGRERIAAMWFGPKGFASVVYGLLVYQSGLPRAADCARLIGLVVVLSIVAHSSTDVLMARWLDRDATRAA